MKKFGPLLIIDDEPDISEILSEIFEPHFEKIVPFNRAQDALDFMKDNEVAMILTDLNMPEIPGDQFVRRIRSEGHLMPVLFVTGYANKETVLSAMRLGVSDVIEKPFVAADLVATVERISEIEKRKFQVYSNLGKEPMKDAKAKKMIGLLQIVNEKKETKKVS